MLYGRQLRKRRFIFAIISVVALALNLAFIHLVYTGFFSPKDMFWDYSHMNVSHTTWPPHLPSYLVFQPRSRHSANESLRLTRHLLPDCIDALFASGSPCHSLSDPPLDVVWTWVNGSDKLIQESMDAARYHHNQPGFTFNFNSKFFRDHDELRHSIRSVLEHFGTHTKQLYIVTSDFPIPIPLMIGDTVYNNTRRLGLIPRWLNVSYVNNWNDRGVQLNLKFHSDIFYAYNSSSFNSYGIESQLIGIDNFIYMNDDFYMMTNLTASDFYTSAYGTVLRMQIDLQVKSDENPYASEGGEWGPLEYTNALLSKRFGSRMRPYTPHSAKSLSLPLVREFSRIWEAQLAVTASHPFRGMTTVHRDVYSMFLFSHFVVERWREGLLWSWTVAKIGGVEGEWGDSERAWAWRGRIGESVVHVQLTRRTSVDDEVVREALGAAGHSVSGKTKYEFLGMDTHMDTVVPRPSFASSAGEPICKLEYKTCFAGEYLSAGDFFKDIAFEKNRECGDCIVHALRGMSGLSGLSAFLPNAQRTLTARQPGEPSTGEDPPHLPLVSDWHHADFSLQNVIPADKATPIRGWTLRMLERCRFVIGQTATIFHQISSEHTARMQLKHVDGATDVALLCLNDDSPRRSQVVDRMLAEWQERRWGRKADWEV